MIDRLLTTKGWERAAILATIVRLPGSGGHPDRANRRTEVCSAEQLAEHNIPGLSANTIRTYVQRWLDANGGKYPKADADIKLPATSWPPVDPSDGGSRTTARNIGRQIAAKPELAQAAAEALVAGAIEHVAETTNRELMQASGRKIIQGPKPPAGAVPRSKPRPKPPEPDHDAEPGDDYWQRVRDALNLLLDVKVRISRGVAVPADVTMLMQILAPEQDWDAAAADLIGDHS
jgi:hypothetical protein